MPVQILKVLVGSKAHGLATESSDTDYRGVFVEPTSDILKLGESTKEVNWVEDEEDNTSYEIGHFLKLAIKSNPSILEVFTAPIVEATEDGLKLRELFQYTWSSKGALDAFVGYSRSQQKKMFDDKFPFRDRKWKYATVYLRVLLQGIWLFQTGNLISAIPNQWLSTFQSIKAGKMRIGEVVDLASGFEATLYDEYEKIGENKKTNLAPINEYLLDVRKRYW